MSTDPKMAFGRQRPVISFCCQGFPAPVYWKFDAGLTLTWNRSNRRIWDEVGTFPLSHASLMPYSLSLMGLPGLRTPEGDPVDFPLGKPLAFLIYLAVEGRAVPRDELARVFWPDSTPERARHSVRQAIWMVRRKLGDEAIQGSDPVEVSPQALTLDIHVLDGALREGDVEGARELWEGPPLSQFSLPECRSWEFWRERQRERWTRRYSQALLDEGRRSMVDRDAAAALSYLEEALALNPFSTEARVLQIDVLLEARDHARARQALDEARDRLESEGEPVAELSALEARLLDFQPSPDAQASERLGESVEFVGRRQELGDLQGLWKRVTAGRVGMACVLGPTGIGKTRLAEEFLRRVVEDGGRVARARGYRGEHRIPWGVVSDLVRQLMTLPGAKGIGSGSERVLRRMLPSLDGSGEEPKAHNPEGGVGRDYLTPAALADAVQDLVEAIGFEEPLVVFVDDWQWVDRESRALLGKVLRRISGFPCLILLAERTGQRRAFRESAEELARQEGGRILALEPLSIRELGDLLGLLAEFSDPESVEAVVAQVHRVTRGNPLFVGEILRKLAEQGVYRWEGGRWVLAVESLPRDLDLPESVQMLIRERLERLSPSGAQLAAALAGERRSVPVGVLRRRAHLDEAVFTRAMGELLDREVVEWVGPKEVDFTHDQLRDAAGRFYNPSRWGDAVLWARGRPVRATTVLVTAVLLLVAGVVEGPRLFGSVDTAGPEPALLDRPFGRGRLIVLADSLLELIPPQHKGEEWMVRPSALRRPPGAPNIIDGPFRTPGGRIRWFGEHYGVEEPPYVVEFLPEGRDTVFFRGPGDDGFYDLAPDGATALITAEDRSASHYRRDLLVLVPGGTPRVLYSSAEIAQSADWSDDGQLIVTPLSGATDTLLILDPLGREQNRWVFPDLRDIYGAEWCAGSRKLLLSGRGNGPQVGDILDTSSGDRVRVGREFLAVNSPVWLGNENHVAYVGISQGGQGVYVEDPETGTVSSILPLQGSERVELRWLPDEVTAPVWRVKIQGGPRVLEWGQGETLAVEVFRSDGTPAVAPVRWRSSDVNVASVNSDGVVTANGIGGAYLVVEAAGWVRDSVPVAVSEARALPSEVLFRETFDGGNLENWVVPDSTYPPPRIVAGERGPVLSLPGDGRYRDFILSRRAFSLRYGATLELDVRLPLTRKDKQRFGVCFQKVRPGPGGTPGDFISVGLAFCAQSPYGMLSGYRDDVIQVYGEPPQVSYLVDASPHLPSDDWVHLALQVRPDGVGSVFLDREKIFETPFVISGHDTSLWRIELHGAAVDTELLFRGITLWRGTRY